MLNLQELRAALGQQSRETREEELKRARDRFAKRKDLNKVLAVAAACDNAGLTPKKYEDGYRIVCGYSWTVYISVTVDGFLEAHDARLASLLAGISAALPGKEWGSSDNPTYKNRRYTIWGEDIHIDLEATLKDDSQKCRRVVVGKKTEERDVFQFVCDGEEVVS